MYDDDTARAIAVRMGVFLSGAAMRSPPGMANAESAVKRVLAEDFFKIAELAGRTGHLQLVALRAANGDARRIVTPVFQAS